MNHPALQIAMRYLHIVSAVAAVGGMTFILACLTPALRAFDEATRAGVMRAAHDRFLRLVWISIAGLTISGIYNWVLLAPAYRAMGPKGNALIGTKVLLALIVFAVVFLRSVGLLGVRRDSTGVGAIDPKAQRRILMINLHLAAIVILLGALLRYYREARGG